MTIHRDEWWDLLEVRMAERLGNGDPAQFVEILIGIIDSGVVERLRSELSKRGLTLEDVMEMRSAVAEAEGQNADAEHHTDGRLDTLHAGLAPGSRVHVKRLFLAQFDENQIADILELEAARVGSFLRQFQIGSDAQEIIRRHLSGETAVDIAKRIGCTRQRVAALVRSFGQEPNAVRNVIGPAEREQILRLRQEGLGYTRIAEKVGVDYYAVRNACRKAARARVNGK